MTDDSLAKGSEVYEVICTASGTTNWNDTTIRLLLSQLPAMMEKVKTREIPSKKQMYQIVSNFMREQGHSFTYLQIENKWKTLLRAYKNAQRRTGFGLTGKHFCMYQKEIRQVLDKLDYTDLEETENDAGDESTSMEPAAYIEFDCTPGIEGEPVAKRICDREAQVEYSAIAAQIVATEMVLDKSNQGPKNSRSKQEQRVAEQLILLRRDLRQLNEAKGRNTDAQVIDQLYLLREDVRRSHEESERNSGKRHREMMQVLNSISSTLKSINCNQTLNVSNQ